MHLPTAEYIGLYLNTDGTGAVRFNVQLGLTIPHMFAIGAGRLAGGIVVILLAGLLLVLGIQAQPRSPGAGSEQ